MRAWSDESRQRGWCGAAGPFWRRAVHAGRGRGPVRAEAARARVGGGGRAVVAALALVAALGPAACGPTMPEPERPAPGAPPEGALPPISERRGALWLHVVYPHEGARLQTRDSTFIYGSTATGEATLWINGDPVPVQPNGAFLAYLPVPADGVYRLRAVAGGETASLEVRVVVPPPPPVLDPDRATIIEGSVFPRGAWVALPGERIEVGFRGTPGGEAALLLPDGRRIPLVERGAAEGASEGQYAFGREEARLVGRRAPGVAEYRGYFGAVPLETRRADVPRPTLVELADAGPVEDNGPAEGGEALYPEGPREALLELVVGSDTATLPLHLNLALVDPARPLVGVAADTNDPQRAEGGQVIARPGPGLTSHYFWPDGTQLTLTGERAGEYRVQLTPNLVAWVPANEVRLLPAGTPPPGGIIGTVRMTPRPEAVDVRIALPARLPFLVEEGERSLAITLYGGVPGTDWLQYGALDPLIERAEWSQPQDQVYRLTLHLSRAPWGYDTRWAGNGDLVVRVRRPPEIDPARPLRGLLIAVDPGHPPAGAVGPTGLTEAEANLAIAARLRPMLEEAGAQVLLTRTGPEPLGLYERTRMAAEANADVLISIHNNAFPDGVNPFVNNGTSVYYFHPHAAELARSLQRELLAELRLRDLGIGRASLALVRPSWMPAVLTETMFLMIPRQEAALRDPEVQERIARAHLRGLIGFLRDRAGR